jgi:hypothetical protein
MGLLRLVGETEALEDSGEPYFDFAIFQKKRLKKFQFMNVGTLFLFT